MTNSILTLSPHRFETSPQKQESTDVVTEIRNREIKYCRDVYEGEHILKATGNKTTYLPSEDRFLLQNNASKSFIDSSYEAYVSGAILINYYKAGIRHVIGSVFKKAPVLNSNEPMLDQMFKNGAMGQKSYTSFITEVMKEVLIAGRSLIYCEYKEVILPNGRRELKTMLSKFRTENIVDIEMDLFGNIEMLKLEQINIDNEKIYWLFEKGVTEDASFTLKILDRADNVEDVMDTDWGNNLPPLILCGIDGILTNATQPQPPLIEVAQLCVALYRETAKRSYFTNQVITPLTVFMGDTTGIKEALDQSGGRAVQIDPNSDVKIVETRGSYIRDINETIAQLRDVIRESLGQVGYEHRVERETAEGVRNRSSGENSFLCFVSNAVTSITKRVVCIVANLANVEDAIEDCEIEFHKDFNREILSDQMIVEAIKQFRDGFIPSEQLEAMLRRKGWYRDDSSSQKMSNFLDDGFEKFIKTVEELAEAEKQRDSEPPISL